MNIDERKEQTVFKATKKKKKNYGIRQCPKSNLKYWQSNFPIRRHRLVDWIKIQLILVCKTYKHKSLKAKAWETLCQAKERRQKAGASFCKWQNRPQVKISQKIVKYHCMLMKRTIHQETIMINDLLNF